MSDSNKLARIKWACRRGMLELDFIFNDFMENGYKQLSDIQQDAFQTFLVNSDPDLYSWLMGFREATNETDIKMVELIRSTQKKF